MLSTMDAFEPLAEAQAFAEDQTRRKIVSDPLARLAWRQVLDATENFSEGCLKRNLVGDALVRWQEDRDWLTEEQDHPFSLEWCAEALWVRARVKLSVAAVREWARKAEHRRRATGGRKAQIVPLDWLDDSRGDLASPA